MEGGESEFSQKNTLNFNELRAINFIMDLENLV